MKILSLLKMTVIGLCVIFVIIFLLTDFDYFYKKKGNKNIVGIILNSTGAAMQKGPESINWRRIAPNDYLYHHHMLLTEDNSSIKYQLVDGTVISQGPASLTMIEYKLRIFKNKKKERTSFIHLTRGSLKVATKKKESTKIKISNTSLKVSGHFESKIEYKDEKLSLSVTKGKANISKNNKEEEVAEGQQMKSSKGHKDVQKSAIPKELLEEIEKEMSEMRKKISESRSMGKVLRRIMKLLFTD